MTPNAEQPTHLYVKNLLKIPDNAERLYDTLTDSQLIGLSMIRLADDVASLRNDGCAIGAEHSRAIAKLNDFKMWVIGIAAGVAGIGALTLFLFAVIEFVRGHRS